MNQHFDTCSDNVSNVPPGAIVAPQTLCGQKRTISKTNTPEFKCPTCMCGSNLCKELRRMFRAKNDPLLRYTYHRVKFPSNTKWQQKVDKKKSIYEDAMNMKFVYDKEYCLATLHFPIKLLMYCQKTNKVSTIKNNPTLACKQSDWDDMKNCGLGGYLPQETDTHQILEYGGKPICFFPPCVKAQEIKYSIDAERAMRSFQQAKKNPQSISSSGHGRASPDSVALPPPEHQGSVLHKLQELQYLISRAHVADGESGERPSQDITTAILKQLLAGRSDLASQLYIKASELPFIDKATISAQVHRRLDPSIIDVLFPGMPTEPQEEYKDSEHASIAREPKVRRAADRNNSVVHRGSLSPTPFDASLEGQEERGKAVCCLCESALDIPALEGSTAATIPDDIRSGVRSSLSLCDPQEANACVPTEVGSWAKGFAQISGKTDPLQSVHKLAEHARRGVSLEEHFDKVLSLGPSPEAIPKAQDSSACESGENWKLVEVLYDTGSGSKLSVRENVYLVKSENPMQAYKLTSKAKRYLDDYGPKSGSIECGILLPMVCTNVGVQFTHPPPEEARYVSIKRINKKKVEQYKEEGGMECPYREISLLRAFGDNKHMHALIDALEDEDYLYIITPHSENRCSLRDEKAYNDYCDLGKSDQELKALFVNVLEIIVYLDQHNLYHGALTPEYFEYHGDRVLLTRMGLAMEIPGEKKSNGPFRVPLGPLDTLSFQAPEVHSQGTVLCSSSSNLWSATITLYFMLTGKTPYSMPSPSDAGFRMYLSLGSLEAMIVYLEDAARMNRMRARTHGNASPHILKLLSNFLRLKPSERLSSQQALAAARRWY